MSMSSDQPMSDSSNSQPEAPQAVQPVSALASRVVQNAAAKLPPLMRQAFILTTQGVSPKAIIQQIGIAHSTLYHWKKYNAQFRAALNAWEQNEVQSSHFSVVSMLPDAVEKVRNKIKYDGNLAFRLLEKTGVLAPRKPESISPRHVRQQIKLELRREKLRARKRREQLRAQETLQKAKEAGAEAKSQAVAIETPCINIFDPSVMDPANSAKLDRVAEELREARKGHPDFNFNEGYVVGAVNADPSEAKAVMEELERRVRERTNGNGTPG